MRNRLALYLALSVIIVLFAACGNENMAVKTQPSDVGVIAAVPEPATAAVTEEVGAGEPAEPVNDVFTLPSGPVRPFAVMIDNQGSKVLPQGGLDKAQIVYEIIVEGGLTRLMPVFWDTDAEMIGPVRSARDYFLDYSLEYDAIYVHYGGSPKALKDIPKLGIKEIDGIYLGPDVFWDLTEDVNNWQDSYTSMEKLKAYAEKRKYGMTADVKFPFTYNQEEIPAEKGETAETVTLKYPSMTSRYEYESATGLYKRFRQGKAHMERVGGNQLTAKNIIIQYVPNHTIKGDPEGRQELITTGAGKGYFITGGKAVKLKWSKASRGAQTKYTDEAGNAITLNSGQTWIQIMPPDGKVVIE